MQEKLKLIETTAIDELNKKKILKLLELNILVKKVK